jgi:hypothetical protein
MQQRFPSEEADIPDSTFTQNVERAFEEVGIDPAKMAGANLSASEIAEIAGRIASIRDRDIAKRRSAVPDQPQDVPRLRCNCSQTDAFLKGN